MDFFDEINNVKKEFPKMNAVSREVHKYKFNFYQWFSIVVFIIFFFLGIIFGNLFATCEASSYFYSDACLVKQFNFSFMIMVWFISLIVCLFIFAIGHIIALLGEINKKLTKFHS